MKPKRQWLNDIMALIGEGRVLNWRRWQLTAWERYARV